MKNTKTHFFGISFLILFLLTFSLQAQSLDQKIDAMASEMYPEDGPGVSILIAKDGKPIYQKAFGLASLELNVPMTTENVFEIGSITKQFTAVAILMLEEQGKLNISDDMLKYIPDYPTKGKTITIHNLLNHTSGIKSYTGMPSFQKFAAQDMTPTELIDHFKNEPMDFDPGEEFRYNNSGYILLGYIIEVVSKMTYEDFIEKNIFEKLGMSNSYYGNNNQIIPNRADGYQKGPNGFENSNYLSMTLPYAAGSLMSTTNDLLIWQNALNNHKLISKESYEKAIHGSTLNNGEHITYGYGLGEEKISGSRTIQHGGGIFGYTTMGIYFPEEKIFVSALSNCNCKNVTGLATQIGALAIGKPIPTKDDAITLTNEQLNAWTGTYEFEGNVLRYVTVEDGKIFSQREGSTKMEVYPLSPNKFIFDANNTSYEFSKDSNGLKQVTMQLSGKEIIGRITDKKAPVEKPSITVSQEILDTYVGKYELQPGFIIEVTTANGQLFGQLTGQPQFEIFAEDEDTFFLKVVTASIDFNKDDSGVVTSLVLHQGGRDMPAKKIE
ncbi:serine hydrolase [Hanstruepera ponticola]|uniref:serine hydrolase n=1 Tax=Hanstruepera ponticola TaxID=2042995 RepID=UPI0017821744|nr:serine hydrolase [Hanstruepera ponticola]